MLQNFHGHIRTSQLVQDAGQQNATMIINNYSHMQCTSRFTTMMQGARYHFTQACDLRGIPKTHPQVVDYSWLLLK